MTCECGGEYKEKDWDEHVQKECRLIVACGCGEELMSWHLSPHQRECPLQKKKALTQQDEHANPKTTRKNFFKAMTQFVELKGEDERFQICFLTSNPVFHDNVPRFNSRSIEFDERALMKCINAFNSTSGPRTMFLLCDSQEYRPFPSSEWSSILVIFQNIFVLDLNDDTTHQNKQLLQDTLNPQHYIHMTGDDLPSVIDLLALSVLCADVPYHDGVLKANKTGLQVRETFKRCDVLFVVATNFNLR
eukprot:CAMPEP_0174251950 /NCGR_PEP_ID=MMETSP0439-20130205/1616_1 /TAXON_ID=0 /ORGANISM="Stereomyxa ramosa, Strain Chinc5" /LENGTH=246 /DNA_ID=CAMNT_0015332405 /DNA_START=223 /DNA_END=963 /DNA_ORIENTATION=-